MILVTGAAGFIGSNVVAALNDRGRNDLVLCDWLGSESRWLNLRKRQFRDFVFPEQLTEFLANTRQISAVIHMGANSSTTFHDGDAMMRTNFQASVRLLDWCAAWAIPMVYASSAATYGDGANGFEDGVSLAALRKLRPLNLYGWTKHQFDLVVAERIERQLPLPPKCIGLKFFNVFGPNEYHKKDMMSVVAKNFEVVTNGGVVKLFKSHRNDYSDGEQKRDFVYVKDVVEVILWALAAGPAHGLFNVGTGQATSFRELIEALFAATGRQTLIDFIAMPEAIRDRYQYFTQASLGLLRAAGYDREFMPIGTAVADYVGYLTKDDRYR